MDKTSLGDRMKRYEKNHDHVLMNRVPVIVRVDGKGFSKWTKKQKCDKPFDVIFMAAMQETMKYVAEHIEGCVFGYTQSDEMTFVLRNDQSLESEPWFGNRLQKICSVVSSMVTVRFNWNHINEDDIGNQSLAFFDARVFTVPNFDEAANVLLWRENDASKNSISAACYYEVAKKIGKGTARKKMHGLNGNQQQELLFQETGINWNNYPTSFKRGSACYKLMRRVKTPDGDVMRRIWVLDKEIPIFTQDRNWLMAKLTEDELIGM